MNTHKIQSYFIIIYILNSLYLKNKLNWVILLYAFISFFKYLDLTLIQF